MKQLLFLILTLTLAAVSVLVGGAIAAEWLYWLWRAKCERERGR